MSTAGIAEVSRTSRVQEHEAMLKAALARPGVRAAMRVYQDWQMRDQELEPYRQVLKTNVIVITTNHTNNKPDGRSG